MSNATTIVRLGHACLAGFVLVILSASLANAQFGYGPKTTIGSNYQQTSTSPSNNGFNLSSCSPASLCYILFQQAPQQKPLIVRHVSCRVSINPGELREGYLTSTKEGAFVNRRTYLSPVFLSGPTWMVNNPAMHLIKPGERPVVLFVSSDAASAWGAECNVSGTLQQP
jgi:hypothetical protein